MIGRTQKKRPAETGQKANNKVNYSTPTDLPSLEVTTSSGLYLILDLDEKHRIVSDEYNFTLQERTDPNRGPKTRKGKKLRKTGGWKDVGYWSDLVQLLLSYSRQKLRESGVANMEEVCRLLETLRAEIRAIGEQCVSLWGKTPGEKDGEKNGKLT